MMGEKEKALCMSVSTTDERNQCAFQLIFPHSLPFLYSLLLPPIFLHFTIKLDPEATNAAPYHRDVSSINCLNNGIFVFGGYRT
jgi:hypothetical protein